LTALLIKLETSIAFIYPLLLTITSFPLRGQNSIAAFTESGKKCLISKSEILSLFISK